MTEVNWTERRSLSLFMFKPVSVLPVWISLPDCSLYEHNSLYMPLTFSSFLLLSYSQMCLVHYMTFQFTACRLQKRQVNLERTLLSCWIVEMRVQGSGRQRWLESLGRVPDKGELHRENMALGESWGVPRCVLPIKFCLHTELHTENWSASVWVETPQDKGKTHHEAPKTNNS